jgi:uncharacterized protein (TIGR00730 family)
MPSVGLFCSAVEGLPPSFGAAATEFGTQCAKRGWRLVYGGGRRGLMGVAARATMAAGGEVIGVMPHFLAAPEVANHDITELRMVDTLAQRKEVMCALSDAFICLPGGVGTLDELLEMITMFDLGLHRKPTFLCNVDGFWEPFRALLEAFDARGVLRPRLRTSYRIVPDVPAALAALEVPLAP